MEEKKSFRHKGERDSVKALKKLCRIHAYDSSLHTRLAEKLHESGHEVAALVTAQKAYGLLQADNPIEAGMLAEQFGKEVMMDDKHPPVSKVYMPLIDIFGKFNLRRHQINLKKGDVLYTTDDPATYIYLLLEGEFSIHIDLGDVKTIINYLHSGSLFGKSAQQKNKLRFSTAVAMEDSTLIRFSRKELTKAFQKFPELEIQFAKEDMLRKRVEALSSIPLLSHLPTGIRFLLASRCWYISYKKDDVIFSPESHLDSALLIVNGTVHLYQEKKGQSTYCGNMTKGHVIGLNKLVSKKDFSLSAIAERDCEMLCMSFKDIADLMNIDSVVRQKVENIAQNFSSQIQRTLLLQAKVKV